MKQIHIFIPSKEDKERLKKIADQAVDKISECKNVEEKAFILKCLIESFEDCHKCYIPFERRFKPNV